jgi:hypothetical protein
LTLEPPSDPLKEALDQRFAVSQSRQLLGSPASLSLRQLIASGGRVLPHHPARRRSARRENEHRGRINEPTNDSPTFINALDEEVGPGIDQALASEGINWDSLPVGAIVTVAFSDGTKTLYIKTNGQFNDHSGWAGVAWNKHGQRINRGGAVQSNPNTSGTGSHCSRVWSIRRPLQLVLLGGDKCTQNVTIIDGSGNQTNLGTIIVPC